MNEEDGNRIAAMEAHLLLTTMVVEGASGSCNDECAAHLNHCPF
jgi:hypothetical protein